MPGPGEPLWLPEDTEAALAWAEAQADLCPGCGRPRDECFDPDGPDYQATLLRCRACEERDKKFTAFDGDREGLYAVLKEVRD